MKSCPARIFGWLTVLPLSTDAFVVTRNSVYSVTSPSPPSSVIPPLPRPQASRVVRFAYGGPGGGRKDEENSKTPQQLLENGASQLAKIPETVEQWLSSIDFSRMISLAEIRDNALEGEFGKRGEAYVAGQLALLACIMFGTVPIFNDLLFFLAGPVALIGGVAIMLLAVQDLGAALSPWPVPPTSSKNAELITTGTFALVRHPIYLGLLLSCVGLSILTESPGRLLLTVLLYLLLEKKSHIEEQALLERYPEQYKLYLDTVKGKFLPDTLPTLNMAKKQSDIDE